MSAYDEKLEALNEEKLRLQYELEDIKQKMLSLKKDNAKLYDSVKQSMEQASMYKTELERDRVFYEEKIAELAKEKSELAKDLDILKVEVQKNDRIYSTVTEAKTEMKKESLKLMDEVRETSMDAVTVIEYVVRDIAKMKLDMDNLNRSDSACQQDIKDEITLMIDLLNKHSEYLTSIKKGFYKINNIREYENSFDDLTLVRNASKLVDGSYVD
ncbi:MAG: hypothetical protein VZR27_06045 [Acutalibacteraceae bacterium]|nr:hypothetical protein [Clostridia bacterium]MEE3450246.1 hypothetical protein [Acutalibacteraceae bacterium]